MSNVVVNFPPHSSLTLLSIFDCCVTDVAPGQGSKTSDYHNSIKIIYYWFLNDFSLYENNLISEIQMFDTLNPINHNLARPLYSYFMTIIIISNTPTWDTPVYEEPWPITPYKCYWLRQVWAGVECCMMGQYLQSLQHESHWEVCPAHSISLSIMNESDQKFVQLSFVDWSPVQAGHHTDRVKLWRS